VVLVFVGGGGGGGAPPPPPHTDPFSPAGVLDIAGV